MICPRAVSRVFLLSLLVSTISSRALRKLRSTDSNDESDLQADSSGRSSSVKTVTKKPEHSSAGRPSVTDVLAGGINTNVGTSISGGRQGGSYDNVDDYSNPQQPVSSDGSFTDQQGFWSDEGSYGSISPSDGASDSGSIDSGTYPEVSYTDYGDTTGNNGYSSVAESDEERKSSGTTGGRRGTKGGTITTSIGTSSFGGRPAVATTGTDNIGGRPIVAATGTGSIGGRPVVVTTGTSGISGRPVVATTGTGSIGGRPVITTIGTSSIRGRPIGGPTGTGSIGGRPVITTIGTSSIRGRPIGGPTGTGSIGGRPIIATTGTGSTAGRPAVSTIGTGSVGGRPVDTSNAGSHGGSFSTSNKGSDHHEGHGDHDHHHHHHSGDPIQWLKDAIRGTPDEDYPILSKVPETSFQCNQQEFPAGIYGDEEARCQVFHICQSGGRHDSFLCPNGTIFNQKYFVCDWWYNYACSDTFGYYSLNADLYMNISSDTISRMMGGFNIATSGVSQGGFFEDSDVTHRGTGGGLFVRDKGGSTGQTTQTTDIQGTDEFSQQPRRTSDSGTQNPGGYPDQKKIYEDTYDQKLGVQPQIDTTGGVNQGGLYEETDDSSRRTVGGIFMTDRGGSSGQTTDTSDADGYSQQPKQTSDSGIQDFGGYPEQKQIDEATLDQNLGVQPQVGVTTGGGQRGIFDEEDGSRQRNDGRVFQEDVGGFTGQNTGQQNIGGYPQQETINDDFDQSRGVQQHQTSTTDGFHQQQKPKTEADGQVQYEYPQQETVDYALDENLGVGQQPQQTSGGSTGQDFSYQQPQQTAGVDFDYQQPQQAQWGDGQNGNVYVQQNVNDDTLNQNLPEQQPQSNSGSSTGFDLGGYNQPQLSHGITEQVARQNVQQQHVNVDFSRQNLDGQQQQQTSGGSTGLNLGGYEQPQSSHGITEQDRVPHVQQQHVNVDFSRQNLGGQQQQQTSGGSTGLNLGGYEQPQSSHGITEQDRVPHVQQQHVNVDFSRQNLGGQQQQQTSGGSTGLNLGGYEQPQSSHGITEQDRVPHVQQQHVNVDFSRQNLGGQQQQQTSGGSTGLNLGGYEQPQSSHGITEQDRVPHVQQQHVNVDFSRQNLDGQQQQQTSGGSTGLNLGGYEQPQSSHGITEQDRVPHVQQQHVNVDFSRQNLDGQQQQQTSGGSTGLNLGGYEQPQSSHGITEQDRVPHVQQQHVNVDFSRQNLAGQQQPQTNEGSAWWRSMNQGAEQGSGYQSQQHERGSSSGTDNSYQQTPQQIFRDNIHDNNANIQQQSYINNDNSVEYQQQTNEGSTGSNFGGYNGQQQISDGGQDWNAHVRRQHSGNNNYDQNVANQQQQSRNEGFIPQGTVGFNQDRQSIGGIVRQNADGYVPQQHAADNYGPNQIVNVQQNLQEFRQQQQRVDDDSGKSISSSFYQQQTAGGGTYSQQQQPAGSGAYSQQQPAGGGAYSQQQQPAGGGAYSQQQQPAGGGAYSQQQQPAGGGAYSQQQQPAGGGAYSQQQQPAGGGAYSQQQQPAGGGAYSQQQQPAGGGAYSQQQQPAGGGAYSQQQQPAGGGAYSQQQQPAGGGAYSQQQQPAGGGAYSQQQQPAGGGAYSQQQQPAGGGAYSQQQQPAGGGAYSQLQQPAGGGAYSQQQQPAGGGAYSQQQQPAGGGTYSQQQQPAGGGAYSQQQIRGGISTSNYRGHQESSTGAIHQNLDRPQQQAFASYDQKQTDSDFVTPQNEDRTRFNQGSNAGGGIIARPAQYNQQTSSFSQSGGYTDLSNGGNLPNRNQHSDNAVVQNQAGYASQFGGLMFIGQVPYKPEMSNLQTQRYLQQNLNRPSVQNAAGFGQQIQYQTGYGTQNSANPSTINPTDHQKNIESTVSGTGQRSSHSPADEWRGFDGRAVFQNNQPNPRQTSNEQFVPFSHKSDVTFQQNQQNVGAQNTERYDNGKQGSYY